MVNTCCIKGCQNRSNRVKKSFYSIPAIITNQGDGTRELSRKRRELWLTRIHRRGDLVPSRSSSVCSDHFHSGKPSYLHDSTSPDWAPCIKLGYETSLASPTRHQRAVSRRKKKIDAEQKSSKEDKTEPAASHRVCSFLLSGSLQSSISTTEHSELSPEMPDEAKMRKLMTDEINRLTTDNQLLRQQNLDSQITPESFNDDHKVKHYTGLASFTVLMAVFHFLEPHINENGRSVLTKFQKVILVLMKLRLNLSVQDLAYRFSVSKSTVSRIFLNTIEMMHIRMKNLIFWPEREDLRKTMPIEFRKYFGFKVAIIIDCFEVFIERPSNLKARASTWSSYKHHNTIKFLIGITPQGVISFLSKAWGGRASDKYITERCNILDKLLPGDLVLADRGFDIQDSVGLMCASVKIPDFTRGKAQLNSIEVERTRKIAHLRIHVERVIGLLRNKYTILQGTLPVVYLFCSSDGIAMVDKIATVCCALTNLCESVIPFD